jgi:hypothetical protein
MDVSDQLHIPGILLPGEESPVATGQRFGAAWTEWETEEDVEGNSIKVQSNNTSGGAEWNDKSLQSG